MSVAKFVQRKGPSERHPAQEGLVSVARFTQRMGPSAAKFTQRKGAQ